jgi:hypothetical protein
MDLVVRFRNFLTSTSFLSSAPQPPHVHLCAPTIIRGSAVVTLEKVALEKSPASSLAMLSFFFHYWSDYLFWFFLLTIRVVKFSPRNMTMQ